MYGFRKDLTCSLSYFYVESGTGRPGMARYESKENMPQVFWPSAFIIGAVCISPGCFEWKQCAFWKLLSKSIISEMSPFWHSSSPGKCPFQHLRILDCCHWADEVQHDEPVPRRGGRGGGQWQGDPGTEAEDPPSSPADPHQESAPCVPGDWVWKWVRLWTPVPASSGFGIRLSTSWTFFFVFVCSCEMLYTSQGFLCCQKDFLCCSNFSFFLPDQSPRAHPFPTSTCIL